MERKPKVKLLDTTLRDSGYAIDFQFSARDTKNICRGLEKSGIRYIEIGHGLGLGASGLKYGVALETDENYIRAATSVLSTAEFGAFFIPGVGKKEDIKKAKDLGMDFIRIGCEPNNIEKSKEFIAYAKELRLFVSLNLMKTYSVSCIELSEIIKNMKDWGMEVICIVDSAGCMLPDEVAEYVRATLDNCDLEVGFHGHNNLGLAHANCLAAVKAGALWIDGTLRGMGRSAGNAQTETLSYILEQAGYAVEVDTISLIETTTKYVEPLMIFPQGIPSMEVVYGMSKFHSSFLPLFKRILAKYDVDLRRLIIEVSKINCVNPSEDLVENIAKDLTRTEAVLA